MSAVIRVDLYDRVVRSTGDPPGVICFGRGPDEKIGFMVSGTWLPEGGSGIELIPEGDNHSEDEMLSVAEVVEGCADEGTEVALWELTLNYAKASIPIALDVGNLRFAHEVLEFVDEVAVELWT